MLKVRKQSGAAQHKCGVCGQTFASITELQEHQRIMHPSRNGEHRCDICGEVFNTEAELGEHRRTMHPEKERARMLGSGCSD
jgi:hypothetical protein